MKLTGWWLSFEQKLVFRFLKGNRLKRNIMGGCVWPLNFPKGSKVPASVLYVLFPRMHAEKLDLLTTETANAIKTIFSQKEPCAKSHGLAPPGVDQYFLCGYGCVHQGLYHIFSCQIL